jgi:hypothetical protein
VVRNAALLNVIIGKVLPTTSPPVVIGIFFDNSAEKFVLFSENDVGKVSANVADDFVFNRNVDISGTLIENAPVTSTFASLLPVLLKKRAVLRFSTLAVLTRAPTVVKCRFVDLVKSSEGIGFLLCVNVLAVTVSKFVAMTAADVAPVSVVDE